MFIHLDNLFWMACGLLTVYLVYGKSEEIPVFKAIIICVFGFLSLLVWCIMNIGKRIKNPLIKKVQHQVVPPSPVIKPVVKRKRRK